MILPIVKIGNRILQTPCSAVSLRALRNHRFRTLTRNLITAMRKARGVGLAANQVGRDLRLIVLECRKNPRYPRRKGFPLQIYVNPRIVRASREKINDWEGCLSIPGYRGLVPRAKDAVVEAFTLEGKKVRRKFSGFEARVIQHEMDHLNGLFYMDRMKNIKAWMCLEEFNKKFRSGVQDR